MPATVENGHLNHRLLREHELPTAVVLYHFFPPDDVVSAVLFGDLSAGLVSSGWEVTAYPSNRDCRDEALCYPASQDLKGVHIRRIWRPGLAQFSSIGRILNAWWMIARWSFLSCNPRIRPDVLIVGTDPILSILIAIIWRRLKPNTKIVHWCFDLYPEAAIADGILKADSRLIALLRALATRAYRACDLIVDIGCCMRRLLRRYNVDTRMETLVPWALEESNQAAPIDEEERRLVFGVTSLALMYSGSFGKAHSCDGIFGLAQMLRNDDVRIAFSVSEPSATALRRSVPHGNKNVVFVPPVPPNQIASRLSAADIHVVTLKKEWAGVVVPSKFFGALSMGRPVLFCGSPESAVAQWINEYSVGWVLTPETSGLIISNLKRLISSRAELEEMFTHCHDVYVKHFSKLVTMNRWNQELQRLLDC
jgi:glycosyltransferase involved in cell wall biosynthesis